MPKSPAKLAASPLSAPPERHLNVEQFSIENADERCEPKKAKRARPTLPTPQTPTLTAQSLLASVGSSAAHKLRKPRSNDVLSRVRAPTQSSLQRSHKRKSQHLESAPMAPTPEMRRLSKERRSDSLKENATNSGFVPKKVSALSKAPSRIPLQASGDM